MATFLKAGKFIVKFYGSRIEASNDEKSFESTLDAETEASIKSYISKMKKKETAVEIRSEESGADKLVLSFSGIYEGMHLDVLNVELRRVSPVGCLGWLFEMVGTVSTLQHQVNDLEATIEEQDLQIEQMIAAKNKYQEHMLEKICAILEARHEGHASLMDAMRANENNGQASVQQANDPLDNIKPEPEENSPDIKIKLEPEHQQDSSQNSPSLTLSASETDTTAEESD